MIASAHRQHLVTALCGVALMTFLMIVLGGFTRLTGSGLSIVSWKPLTGILPPLTHADWMAEFAHYQQFPEYQQVNRGMTLAGFQSIFWLEFIHRLIGRLIGLVLLIPTLMTFLSAPLRPYRAHVGLIWILGLIQGVLGWYMVKSGLVHHPAVNPYRLTAHLLLAFLILAYILWLCAVLILPRGRKAQEMLRLFPVGLMLLIATISFGGLTAGSHAGLIYNTFPKMDGYWIPPELEVVAHQGMAIFQEPAVVQFMHRCLAMVTLLVLFLLGQQGQRALRPSIRRQFRGLQVAIFAQCVLGILTLLGRVPVNLAALHQAWAAVTFCGAWWIYLQVRRGAMIWENKR